MLIKKTKKPYLLDSKTAKFYSEPKKKRKKKLNEAKSLKYYNVKLLKKNLVILMTAKIF